MEFQNLPTDAAEIWTPSNNLDNEFLSGLASILLISMSSGLGLLFSLL